MTEVNTGIQWRQGHSPVDLVRANREGLGESVGILRNMLDVADVTKIEVVVDSGDRQQTIVVAAGAGDRLSLYVQSSYDGDRSYLIEPDNSTLSIEGKDGWHNLLLDGGYAASAAVTDIGRLTAAVSYKVSKLGRKPVERVQRS